MSKKVEKITGEVNMNLTELDFYLWYVKMGKVLK
jgi:thermostable 8-oxoguanine DNA glycosylase